VADVAAFVHSRVHRLEEKNLQAFLKRSVAAIPVVGPALRRAFRSVVSQRSFPGSRKYWEERYRAGGNSGAGSYNRLAHFKANFLNQFVLDNGIQSVVEFGCGDGAQLALASYPAYHGYDVSVQAVELCKRKFASHQNRQFDLVGGADPIVAELSLSLDVLYHLVEDDVFDLYMTSLFKTASKFVIVYSSDEDRPTEDPHVRHRKFTNWVARRAPDWQLLQVVKNAYPYEASDPQNTSFADFFVFQSVEKLKKVG
jgi:hypothetical protein